MEIDQSNGDNITGNIKQTRTCSWLLSIKEQSKPYTALYYVKYQYNVYLWLAPSTYRYMGSFSMIETSIGLEDITTHIPYTIDQAINYSIIVSKYWSVMKRKEAHY